MIERKMRTNMNKQKKKREKERKHIDIIMDIR